MKRMQAHATTIYGTGGPTIMLAHGIGGKQSHWQSFVDYFTPSARLITYSLAGSPDTDPASFSYKRHASIFGAADDLAMLCAEMNIRDAVYIGHSLSAMTGVLVSVADPGLFSRLILVNGSARYLDDPATGYMGGFMPDDVHTLLHDLMADYATWAAGFGSTMIANPDRPRLVTEFVQSLAAYSPEVTATYMRALFNGDYRQHVKKINVPTLIVQSANDPAISQQASRWLSDNIRGAQRADLQSTGHFPHLVAPDELIRAVEAFALG